MSPTSAHEFSRRRCATDETTEPRSPSSPGSEGSSFCDDRDHSLRRKASSIVDSLFSGSDSRYQSPVRSQPAGASINNAERRQRSSHTSKLHSARSTEALLSRMHMEESVHRSTSEPPLYGPPEHTHDKSGAIATKLVTSEGLESATDNGTLLRQPQKRASHSQCNAEVEESIPNLAIHPTGKRRKLERKFEGKDCFPCIFHAGEPSVYPTHTKRYEYVSQLLRHLKSHEFYACSKCFSRFENPAEQELHNYSPCYKACRSRKCTRHIRPGAEAPVTCRCITKAEDQWKELYRLQYPGAPFVESLNSQYEYRSNPAAKENTASSSATTQALVTVSSQINGGSDPTILRERVERGESGFVGDVFWPPRQQQNTGVAASGEADVSAVWLSETQLLRKKIQALEQQLSQTNKMTCRPSSREEDLELLLANVWGAFSRTDSPEAQPNSAVWRLVRRFAPSLLGPAVD